MQLTLQDIHQCTAIVELQHDVIYFRNSTHVHPQNASLHQVISYELHHHAMETGRHSGQNPQILSELFHSGSIAPAADPFATPSPEPES